MGVLSLVGAPEPEEADADLAAVGGDPAFNAVGEAKNSSTTPVNIVLLLPDGRWQELNLNKLELRAPTAAELGLWSTHLIAASQGKVARPAQKPSQIAGKSSSRDAGPAPGMSPSIAPNRGID